MPVPAGVALDALVGDEVTQGFTPAGTGGSADQTWVPVVPALAGLLPGGALRRGSVVTAAGSGALLLALLSEASSSGGWCAEVGSAGLGAAAAAELGIALDRFVRVPRPGDRWPEVVAALLDGFDVVVVHPWVPESSTRRSSSAGRVTQAVRRLTARARDRRAAVIASWPWEGAALSLAVTRQRWHGLGAGHGYLAAREVEVVATGRGSAVRPRRTRVWLPGPDGRVALYEDGLAVLDRVLPPACDSTTTLSATSSAISGPASDELSDRRLVRARSEPDSSSGKLAG